MQRVEDRPNASRSRQVPAHAGPGVVARDVPRSQLIAQTFVDLYGSEAGSHEDMAKVMPAVFAAAQASVDAGDD